jgi:hypothetical protein
MVRRTWQYSHESLWTSTPDKASENPRFDATSLSVLSVGERRPRLEARCFSEQD